MDIFWIAFWTLVALVAALALYARRRLTGEAGAANTPPAAAKQEKAPVPAKLSREQARQWLDDFLLKQQDNNKKS